MFSGISFAVGILLAGGKGGLGKGRCGELYLWSSSVGPSNAVGGFLAVSGVEGSAWARLAFRGLSCLGGFGCSLLVVSILGVVYDCHL